MVNVRLMMKLQLTADQLLPCVLYLPVSNLTAPLLRPDGCIHNANAQQLCKHITLDCNQWGRVSACGSIAHTRDGGILDVNQSCLGEPALMLCKCAVVFLYNEYKLGEQDHIVDKWKPNGEYVQGIERH